MITSIYAWTALRKTKGVVTVTKIQEEQLRFMMIALEVVHKALRTKLAKMRRELRKA